MPVRSSNSPVLKWPDRKAVEAAVRILAERLSEQHPELMRLGYFGSYARGDWGVGSDVDLVAIVKRSSKPFVERALDFDLRGLPVGGELLVYTEEEWRALLAENNGFAQVLAREAVWLIP